MARLSREFIELNRKKKMLFESTDVSVFGREMSLLLAVLDRRFVSLFKRLFVDLRDDTQITDMLAFLVYHACVCLCFS